MIMITGAQGQLGWALQGALSPLGEIAAFDRAALDLADHGALRAKVLELKPRLILNAGAYTAVDQAESKPDQAMAINGVAPGVLAEAAEAVGAALVHFSTDYVFDGEGFLDADGQRRPYTESDPVAPLNLYGQSKLAGEQAVAQACSRWTTLRLAWVYDSTRGHNFLRTMLRLGATRPELQIVHDQLGAPTWVRGIAAAVAQIAAAHLRGDPSPQGLFHLPAGGETSWSAYAEAIFELAPPALLPHTPKVIPVPSSAWPTPAARPAYSVMSGEKLAQRMGLRLPHWRDQLRLALGAL